MKSFFLKEVFFQFDLKNNGYAIIDNIFLNKGKIRSIRFISKFFLNDIL